MELDVIMSNFTPEEYALVDLHENDRVYKKHLKDGFQNDIFTYASNSRFQNLNPHKARNQPISSGLVR